MADIILPDTDHDYKLYVYVMESEAGPQKVGHSGDPQNRLLELMTGHPFGLEVAYARHHEQAPLLEKMAHRILDNCKIAGRREWFKCSREAAIYAVDAAFDILEMMKNSVKSGIVRQSAKTGNVISLARNFAVIWATNHTWSSFAHGAFVAHADRDLDLIGDFSHQQLSQTPFLSQPCQ